MNAQPPRRRGLRRILRRSGALFLALLALGLARCLYVFRDRDPSATFALELTDDAWHREPHPLRAGFGRVKINPDLSNPARPVYLAGFDQNRRATGVHDDLWAIACVIDDGHHRLGIASLDAIGLFHEAVVDIRRRLTAASALEPAQVAFHQLPLPTDGLVTDTRKPIVYDPDLRLMHFTRPSDNRTLGTLITWANHPETVWSRNTEITSDFCGYLRDALEHGIDFEGRTVLPGFGGIHLYVNGAVGGLMTTSPSVTVAHPFSGAPLEQPSHEKARALGWQLAARIAPVLAQPTIPTPQAPIAIRAHTLEIPLDNWAFLLAPVLGLLDRGHSSWMKLRTEVALLTFGESSIACVPGEIYPELVNGGIERAPGGDFDGDPVEIPPLRDLMPGRIKFVFGLANDEIGYIIPKSEWDRKPPYLYGSSNGVYGEINSVGPECAPTLHAAFRKLARD